MSVAGLVRSRERKNKFLWLVLYFHVFLSLYVST